MKNGAVFGIVKKPGISVEGRAASDVICLMRRDPGVRRDGKGLMRQVSEGKA